MGSLLIGLARTLRNNGLALTGLGHIQWPDGGQETEDLDALARSLERTATLLESVSAHLCSACNLKEVTERVTFGDIQVKAPEIRRKPILRKA